VPKIGTAFRLHTYSASAGRILAVLPAGVPTGCIAPQRRAGKPTSRVKIDFTSDTRCVYATLQNLPFSTAGLGWIKKMERWAIFARNPTFALFFGCSV